jgi:hypothetical protein
MAFGLSGHGNAGVEVGGSSAIKNRFSLGRLGISGTSGDVNSGFEVGGGGGIEINNQFQSKFGGLVKVDSGIGANLTVLSPPGGGAPGLGRNKVG